jgi:hypothetical protein
MLLSNYLLSGGVKPYLEYGWVTAPNATAQTITNNTITTLTIDTEIVDTGNNGSISGNQITLAAGTYYFEANAPIVTSNGAYYSYILSLRNNVTTTPIIISSVSNSLLSASNGITVLKGQFTILASSVFDLTLICATSSGSTLNGVTAQYVTPFTLSTAGTDQRTTIKLWKLA